MSDWHTTPATDLEAAIIEFKAALPGWWYSVCECQVSCDASCAPTTDSPHIDLITEAGDRFDAGFHADLSQPSSLADALRTVMRDALAAIAERAAQEALMTNISTERLLPCPFCGLSEAYIADTMPGGAYWCVCAHCGAETQSSQRQSEAIAAWNCRSLDKGEVDGENLGRFDHHPDPAIDFEIEVQSLEARLFDAKGGISKPGTVPERIDAVLNDIERAMTFRVGGDPSAVAAKAVLRNLEVDAKAALVSQPAPKGVEITARHILAWVREDVLPAYGITHDTRLSDPEMVDGCRAALEAAMKEA